MAKDDDFYTAWDGNRYTGDPPAGWFLAADNRWWPPPSMIEGGAQNTDQQPSAPHTDSTTTGLAGEPTTPSRPLPTTPSPPTGSSPPIDPSPPTQQPGPPDSWAPETLGTDRAAGDGRSTTGRGGKRFPIGPVLIIVFLLSMYAESIAQFLESIW